MQGGALVNYWVSAVDARNREYAQLMRKFQVEANLHDTSKRSLSEQLLAKQELQVCLRVQHDRPTAGSHPSQLFSLQQQTQAGCQWNDDRA